MSFEKIAEGTYGKVYLCHETLEIRKSMSKRVVFNTSNQEAATDDDPLVPNVEYGAVTELSVYNSLLPSMPGIPQFLHYDEGNDNVELYMTYCGDTVHRWLRNRSFSQIAEVLPSIMLQLTDTCCRLYMQGIQHTDLKPTNMLIDPYTHQITLIDFNLVSFLQKDGTWTPSFGTWCYVAPEILSQEIPTDTSTSWTLGILMAFIAHKYPLGDYATLKPEQLNSREYWHKRFRQIKQTCNHLPLLMPSRLPPEFHDLYKRCTMWEPRSRPSLFEVRDELIRIMNNTPARTLSSSSSSSSNVPSQSSALPPYHFKLFAPIATSLPYWAQPIQPMKSREERSNLFKRVYALAKETGLYHIYIPAVTMMDRCANLSMDRYAIGATCIHIALLVYCQYQNCDDIINKRVFKTWNIYQASPTTNPSSVTRGCLAEEFLWAIGCFLGWKVLVPSSLLLTKESELYSAHLHLVKLQRSYSLKDLDIHIRTIHKGKRTSKQGTLLNTLLSNEISITLSSSEHCQIDRPLTSQQELSSSTQNSASTATYKSCTNENPPIP